MKKLISGAMLGLMLVAAPLAAYAATSTDSGSGSGSGTTQTPPSSGKKHKKHAKHGKKKSGSGSTTAAPTAN